MPALLLTESAIYTALRTFLLGAIVTDPATTEIVRAQENRVPMPYGADFAIFTPLRNERLATNDTAYLEIRFTGEITDDVLTVTEMEFGTGLMPHLVIDSLFWTVVIGTRIAAQIDGTPGGVGTYRITPGGQTVPSIAMYSSTRLDLAATQLTAQVDWYGPNAWANAQAVETLFRSSYGTRVIEGINADVTALYCDSARQVAFIDGEQQWEDRWMSELALQVNPTLLTLQDAATQAEIWLTPADLLKEET